MSLPDQLDDPINPRHYRLEGEETIDRIRAALGAEGFVAYCRGSAMKYRARAGHKTNASEQEDLDKARWYETMARHVLLPHLCDDPRSER